MRLMVEMPKAPGQGDRFFEDYVKASSPGPNQADALKDVIVAIVRLYGAAGFEPDRVVDLPSLGFTSPAPPPGQTAPSRSDMLDKLGHLIIAVEFDDPGKVPAFIARVRGAGGRVGADPPIASLGAHWNPYADMPPLFHTRPAAEALIHADALPARQLLGEDVNLVFFDEGISLQALAQRFARLPRIAAQPKAIRPRLRYAGGWDVAQAAAPLSQFKFVKAGSASQPALDKRRAGRAKPASHGTMVALNALSLAPAARVFDLPVLPDRIRSVIPFASFAAAALIWAETEISLWLAKAYPGRWVFCHAWGVFDRRLESPFGGYTADPLNPLNVRVASFDRELRRDQIFGAGNGGQFAPHPQCGPGDIGPGNSILGANSSPHVLSVGAVRADGAWIGYSSQGPGQPEFQSSPLGGLMFPGMIEKPDLCAPSHFVEPKDAAWLSSGTSAACGIAAGAVAALRSKNSPLLNRSPAELRERLRATAQKPAGEPPGYDIRLGHGILNLEAALQAPP